MTSHAPRTPFGKVIRGTQPTFVRFYGQGEVRQALDRDEWAAATAAISALSTSLEGFEVYPLTELRSHLIVVFTTIAGRLYTAVGQCRKPESIEQTTGRLVDRPEDWRELLTAAGDNEELLRRWLRTNVFSSLSGVLAPPTASSDVSAYESLHLPAFHEAALSLVARLRLTAAVIALAHDGHLPMFENDLDLALGERLATRAFFDRHLPAPQARRAST